MDEETETEQFHNLSKVRQLVNSKAKISGSRVHILNPYATMTVQSDGFILFLPSLIIVLC